MTRLIQEHWKAAFEIFILSIFIYFILNFIRGTRGARVLIGLVMLLLFFTVMSQVFDLKAISWLLGHFFSFIVVALVVIFQPELRRALAEVGSQPIFFTISKERAVIDILVNTADLFATRKVGALIAVEREIGVRGIAEAGAPLDARLSQELLEQLFYPNSPLHDGGVIIHNDRVVAAACIFPLSQRADLAKSVGTRHRAAIGLAEETDAVIVAVSEETGAISVVCQRELHSNLDRAGLHELLTRLLVGGSAASGRADFRSLLKSGV